MMMVIMMVMEMMMNEISHIPSGLLISLSV